MILLFVHRVQAQQPIGIINDRKEEVIVRNGQGAGFGQVVRISEGQQFKYWPEEAEEWWYVETIVDTDDPHEGYLHRDQVRPYYAADPGCGCPQKAENASVLTQTIQNRPVTVCGELLQRQAEGQIIIRSFSVNDCSTGSRIAYYGHTEIILIKATPGELQLRSLMKLPSGPDWTPARIPISEHEIIWQEGAYKATNRRFIADPNLEPSQIELFLKSLKLLKGKGYVLGTSYQSILDKLLASGLAGSEPAETVLREANDFFGFDFRRDLYHQYTVAIALLDWKGSK